MCVNDQRYVLIACLCQYEHTHMWASYSGSAVCRSSFADQEFNNIQVVVMDGHMKRCQTILLNTQTYTCTHTYIPIDTYTQTNTHINTCIYETHNMLIHQSAHIPNISPSGYIFNSSASLIFLIFIWCTWGEWTTGNGMSHLPSSIRVGSSLQKELSYIHLPIFRCHMERSEAFLLVNTPTNNTNEFILCSFIMKQLGFIKRNWNKSNIFSFPHVVSPVSFCHKLELTFVIFICCAPASNKMRIVWTCPSRAEMWRGVWPAVVAESGLALCSRSSLTSSLWPMRAAQCKGVWSSCSWKEGFVYVLSR